MLSRRRPEIRHTLRWHGSSHRVFRAVREHVHATWRADKLDLDAMGAAASDALVWTDSAVYHGTALWRMEQRIMRCLLEDTWGEDMQPIADEAAAWLAQVAAAHSTIQANIREAKPIYNGEFFGWVRDLG